jgi:hypothetical protein
MFRLIVALALVACAMAEAATCADAQKLPACTLALVDADEDCYGTADEDCTLNDGTDACAEADFPALVQTDCTTDTAVFGTTCMAVTTTTAPPDGGYGEYTVSVTMCTMASGCIAGTDATTGQVTTCIADSTDCMTGSSCTVSGVIAGDKTCMTVSVKEGDSMGDANRPRAPSLTTVTTFPMTIAQCISPENCAAFKALHPNNDINCADAATSCAVGHTCSAGSMAQVSMSAVLFALCAAMYQL